MFSGCTVLSDSKETKLGGSHQETSISASDNKVYGDKRYILTPSDNISDNSSRSTEFNDILPWNISQMIMKTVPEHPN